MSTVKQDDFKRLVELAMADPSVANMRPVVEKELLHYDVLFALDRENLLNDLVFQGGTALRLCYGANRFSEDLDFVGGPSFNATSLADIKECVEHYIGARYNLEVSVKEPASLRRERLDHGVSVDKWQIAIATTPQRKDLPNQRIKLEIANLPALTTSSVALRRNYEFLPDGYEDILMPVESLDEIMADKLVSLPATTKYVRHRDVWDLAWLDQRGAKPDPDMVASKVADYAIDDYADKLESMLERLPQIVDSPAFHDEMKRFLPTDVIERTLTREGFTDYLNTTVSARLAEISYALEDAPTSGPSFSM